jgi:hypothetical protein
LTVGQGMPAMDLRSLGRGRQQFSAAGFGRHAHQVR